MRILLKILNIFFVILGVIFFIFLISMSYIWVADPFDIKPLFSLGMSPVSVINTITGDNKIEIDNIDKNPLLNEEQEAQLEALGIEPADLPSEITPEMATCFTKELGEARANEIIKGSAPTAADFLKARSCIN